MCPHTPQCPEASAPDREAAHTVVSHPEQGWSLLCNGIVIFEDTGELYLTASPSHRTAPPTCVSTRHGAGRRPAWRACSGGLIRRRPQRAGCSVQSPLLNP